MFSTVFLRHVICYSYECLADIRDTDVLVGTKDFDACRVNQYNGI